MKRKRHFKGCDVALIALVLGGCDATHRQADQPGAATLRAWTRFQACANQVIDKPEYAALKAHTLNLETIQTTTAQLTDETLPTERDARLFAARFDGVNPCREGFLKDVSIPRPDLTPILADQFTLSGSIAVLVVERKVTWAEAAQRSQELSNSTLQKITAANLEWAGYLNPFHQPSMAQRQAAAAASQGPS